MVIGNDLYQILRSFLTSSLSTSSFDDDYDFKMAGEYSITGLKHAYPLYSLINKYTNNKNNNNTTAIQDADNENTMQLQEREEEKIEPEKQEKEREQIMHQENKAKNILLIDDESDIIFTYKSMLNEEGYNVDTFTDPRQALRHFARQDPLHYKLILLDVRMPDVNGFQIYYKFKAMNPNVKIIFVTALDIMGEEISSMLPNFSAEHDLIKKPVTKDQYVYKIRSVLST